MSHAGQSSDDNLVKMVNQIAQFFEAESGEAAPASVAEHLRKFWDPRMRRRIVRYALEGGQGLRPAAASAVALLAGG